MSAIYIVGMGGMGDCIHQRAVVRYHLSLGREVWLQTPWPQIYWDMPQVRLLPMQTRLRTQAKNAAANRRRFDDQSLPENVTWQQVSYSPTAIRQHGSVLRAMLACSGVPLTETDFRMPIDPTWSAPKIATDKPILVYRPLVERTEWTGGATRNPLALAYRALFDSIRDRFFVVSVADLLPDVEWIAGYPVKADLEFHSGELTFEALAALVGQAAMTFAAPGFLTILAQAVGTPSVCVFGGYESGSSFTSGAQWAPHLAIEPITPCPCFRHDHKCDKRVDMSKALAALEKFVDETADRSSR